MSELEVDDIEPIDVEEEDGENTEGQDDNCGFKPFDRESEELENGTKPPTRGMSNYGSKEERAEAEAIMDKISRLLCRYPGLIPRTTMPAMERLEGMSIRELRNVYKNCISDVLLLRGSPSSEFVIVCVTHKIDEKYAKGYTRRCLADKELKRDVEEEIVNFLGILPNPIVILFRFANNLYKTIYDIRESEEDELFYPREENNRTYGQEKENVEDATSRANPNSEFIHPIGERSGFKRGREEGLEEERSTKRRRKKGGKAAEESYGGEEPEHPNYAR